MLVYVVDDDAAVRDSMQMLMKVNGWRSQLFSSAEECLAALKAEQPNCIICDLAMPQMTGADLVEELARRNHRIGVVVMTGSPRSSLADRAKAAGVTAILAKPTAWGKVEEAVLHAASARAMQSP